MTSQTEQHNDDGPVGLIPYQRRVDELIADNASARPCDEAIKDASGAVTWLELNEKVSACAERFEKAGIQEGDRIAFLIANSIEAYVALYGAMRAGAIIAPISTMLSPEDVGRLILDAGARVVIVAKAFAELAESTYTQAVEGTMPPWSFLGSEADLVLNGGATPSYVADACSIIYSSGTTGLPKGAVHTHQARVIAAQNAAIAFSVHAGSRGLVSTPPYTNGSWMILLPALATGASVYLSSAFELEGFLRTCSDWKPTHAFIVPTQFQMLFDSETYDPRLMESFRCMITAGAPMPPAMKERIMRELPDRLYELWGLTEVAATVLRPEEMQVRPDSVGRAIPLSEFRIIDEEDREVSKPGTGEIVARSLYQMTQYWGSAELNDGLRWEADDGSSFMRTGDIGEFDAQGYIYIRGRVKDMIISGGLNVFPIDIENTLRTHTDISDAAVVGIPQAKWGEVPVAFIRCSEGGLDTAEVLDWANERLSKFQRLRDVVIVHDDFPRNTLGKVLKRLLVESYDQESAEKEALS